MPADYLANLSVEPRTQLWQSVLSDREHGAFVVETSDGTIVGFANGGRQHSPEIPADGVLYTLYLLKRYHGLGIGRRLMGAVVDRMHEQGFQSLLVWVLAQNPSRGFYQALGGVELQRRTIEIGGAELEEIGYHWTDIAKVGARPG